MCESIYRGWWNESVGENEYVISNGVGWVDIYMGVTE